MHSAPGFEIKDELGKTLQFSGVVGLVGVAYPAAPQGQLSEVLLRNPDTNNITTKLFLSFDGGVSFFSLARGEFIGWSPKKTNSNTPIEQVIIRGSVASTNFELLVNVEP